MPQIYENIRTKLTLGQFKSLIKQKCIEYKNVNSKKKKVLFQKNIITSPLPSPAVNSIYIVMIMKTLIQKKIINCPC